MNRKIIIPAVLLLAFALAAPIVTAQDNPAWSIETVDSEGDVGRFSSIALDSTGNPHISYYDQTNYDLKYAKWTGTEWSIETVDSEGDVGSHSSIALDSAGNPHISYFDYTNENLKYAKWTGTEWSIETVDSEKTVGWCTSIAVDSAGNPHISYFDHTNVDLKYAKWTGTEWAIQTVDPEVVGWFTSIAVDSAGNPHISYLDYTNGDLKYAKWTGIEWAIQTVDPEVGSWYTSYTSIAVDSAGNPHISYLDYTNGDLKYAKWTGIEWTIQTVDSEGDVGWFTSIAVDSAGNPHISYFDYTNDDLKYAKWTGTEWAIQTVDLEGDVGRYTSIAVDSTGNPHISYIDGSNYDLKYAFLGFVDDVGPITSNLLADPNPVSVNTEITLTATVDDSLTGGSTIGSAEYNIDGGNYIQMDAQDGNFDEVTEDVEVIIPAFAEPGVHSICVHGNDRFNNVGTEDCILLAVYDPTGGFVTGGGWINSPAGAYVPDDTLTDKANFGFISKYKKGATVPTGQTQFRFKVADLNFYSDTYDWLVVAGPKAMYKGTGTINGEGNYGFMLSAIDEELTPSTDVDMFRIKIWDKDDGDAVVYDNQIGDADDADLTTAIGGGSIKIHKG
jgi:hypothetical protein